MTPATVTCPTCRREHEWATAPFRPFCSERCRLIDLGAWLSEQHSIPGDPVSAPEETAAEPPGKPAS